MENLPFLFLHFSVNTDLQISVFTEIHISPLV